MDVGGATDWSLAQVFSRKEMLAALEKRYGAHRAGRERFFEFERSCRDGSVSRMARSLASSRPLPPHFAGIAIAADSPPTACGICASMRARHRSAQASAGWRIARGNCGCDLADLGAAHGSRRRRARFAAEAQGVWFLSSNCGRIRTSRCTRAEASIARRLIAHMPFVAAPRRK